jgi:hypothetical protein
MGTSTLDRGLAFGLKLPVYRKEAIFERLMALWDAARATLGLGIRGKQISRNKMGPTAAEPFEPSEVAADQTLQRRCC